VVRGARQVGKSWLIEAFGREAFDSLVKLDFERDPGLASLFEARGPREVLALLETQTRTAIRPGRTLLFLDEIQAAPAVLARLRYFAEELPALHVIAAGSLLDVALADHAFAMPVGRISYLHLEPMTFDEFLAADDSRGLAAYLAELDADTEIPALIHDQLLERLRTYLLVGGMPAAVEAWLATGSLLEVARVQSDLLATFRDDFGKYRRRFPEDRLTKVFAALPRMVGRKFVAARIDHDDRAAPIKEAFRLLTLARVVTPVRRSACNGVPLGAEVDDAWFKVCLLDTGLYAAQLGIDASGLANTRELTLVHEGQLAEQFVGQELRAARPAHEEPALFCWIREQRTSNAEVDYVIAERQTVVPLEVKAGATGRLRSLHAFVRDKRRHLAVRLWSGPPQLIATTTALPDGPPWSFRLLSLPLYAAGQVRRLVAAAQADQGTT